MEFTTISRTFIESFGVDQLNPPIVPVGIKFFSKGMNHPEEEPLLENTSIPWCGAVKLAAEGEMVVVTKKNIGCPAAAVALGLVDQNDSKPLEGMRQYTSLMNTCAAPKDFTNGYVYACRGSGHMEFALFGENDSGRYKTLGASLNAVSAMPGIGKEMMDAVITFPAHLAKYTPDVVILAVSPKQALRIIQGYAFASGQRIELSTIGIRGVCADVTAYPYLKQKLNGSFFCLGARALGGWQANQLALGMPYDHFKQMTEGMIASQTGFPYKLYP